MAKITKYSEANIQTLKWHEAIRKRAGMYIGSVDHRGFMNNLKGFLSQFLTFTKSDAFTFEFRNGNIGFLKFEKVKVPVSNNWSRLDYSQFRAAINELHTLNALSSTFTVQLLDTHGNRIHEQNFEKGENKNEEEKHKYLDCAAIEVDFELDKEIWKEEFEWNENYINHELQHFAYLFKNVKFNLKYEHDGAPCNIIYHFKNGLKDRIELEKFNGLGGSYFETYIEKKIDNFSIEVSFAFRDYTVDKPFLKSYVNNHFTFENGSHVDGLLKGLTYGVMKYFKKNDLVNSYKISEKGIKENLIAAINIKMDAPVFSGCVKNKLANSEVIEPIADCVAELFFKKILENEEATKKLIRKFEM